MKELTAADLRVGNIVGRGYMNPTPNGLKKEHEPCQIYSIGIERVIVNSKLNSKGLIKMGYDNIKPITLTEEWLLRLGFEKTMSWTFAKELIGNNILVYYLGEKGVSIGFKNYSDFKCEYVHQLQNLYFALTGEELTLTDEK